MEKHWETIPQGTGAAWGLLIAVRAGAGSPASIGSSRPVEMGKTHGSAKLEDGGQNIIPLCFPWELVSHCVLLVPVDLGLILLLATR